MTYKFIIAAMSNAWASSSAAAPSAAAAEHGLPSIYRLSPGFDVAGSELAMATGRLGLLFHATELWAAYSILCSYRRRATVYVFAGGMLSSPKSTWRRVQRLTLRVTTSHGAQVGLHVAYVSTYTVNEDVYSEINSISLKVFTLY